MYILLHTLAIIPVLPRCCHLFHCPVCPPDLDGDVSRVIVVEDGPGLIDHQILGLAVEGGPLPVTYHQGIGRDVPRAQRTPSWEIPQKSPIYPYNMWVCMGYYPQESLYKPYKYHGYTVRGTPNCPLIPGFIIIPIHK